MSSFLVNKLDILLFELYFQISLNNCLESNKIQQKNLLEADGVSIKNNLNELTERKTELSIYLNNFKIIERLQIQLEKEIPYENDKIHGTWKEYDENGELKSETTYVDGEIL